MSTGEFFAWCFVVGWAVSFVWVLCALWLGARTPKPPRCEKQGCPDSGDVFQDQDDNCGCGFNDCNGRPGHELF